MRGKWLCHEATFAADIARDHLRVDPGFLSEPVAGAGVEAAAVACPIFSFLLCEFFDGHRVYRSGCRVGGADLSALINLLYLASNSTK